MANEFGDDFIVLTTEDGREIELEQLSALEDGGALYGLFCEADAGEDNYELVILRQSVEDGEIYWEIPEEEEYGRISDLFDQQLFSDAEEI